MSDIKLVSRQHSAVRVMRAGWCIVLLLVSMIALLHQISRLQDSNRSFEMVEKFYSTSEKVIHGA